MTKLAVHRSGLVKPFMIIVLGMESCGKTTLITRYLNIHKENYLKTIEDYYTKIMPNGLQIDFIESLDRLNYMSLIGNCTRKVEMHSY